MGTDPHYRILKGQGPKHINTFNSIKRLNEANVTSSSHLVPVCPCEA